MICSRCSLGAALLVERNKIINDPNQVVAMRYGDMGLVIDHVMLNLAREMHKRCGDKCDCQHRENVVVGIDWSKVKGSSNGTNENVEEATS